MDRIQALKGLLNDGTDTLFVTTDGLISRDAYAMQQKNLFPMTGSFGLASSIAFGLALNTTKKVICIDGDGACLASLGMQAVIEEYNLPNFRHIVLDNGCYETTGGQKCVKLPKFKGIERYRLSKLIESNSPRLENLPEIAKKFIEDVKT